jgi:hypothetical protein
MDREDEELAFPPSYSKTVDLAKEMQEELGGTSYHTLILEVVKATWNAKQNPPQTLEVEAIAIR